MSNLSDLKKKIYKDNRVEELLEKLGCHRIRSEKGGELFVAARPDGDNSRSVQVYNNEYLNSHVRSKGIDGDIYSLIAFIKYGCVTEEEMKKQLKAAKEWIIDNLGYHEFRNPSKRITGIENSWLKDIKKKRSKDISLDDIKENVILDESVINEYIMIPHKLWIDEGISYETQEEFECGFDLESNRIVVLIRNKKGELIGVKGRTVDEDYEEREIPKYLYLYKMNKSIELYNLHRALEHILSTKEIIVFEGYKSVMKAWEYGYKNCVSIEGDNFSKAQVALIKSLGLDIEITLCFDKDKSVRFIKEQAQKFTNRNVFATYDMDDLLEEKQSPVDQGKETWENLHRNKLSIPIKNNVLYNL